jgi:hypothetical protein
VNVYLHDVQVSISLIDASEELTGFSEVSFFVVPEVSKWKNKQRLSFV